MRSLIPATIAIALLMGSATAVAAQSDVTSQPSSGCDAPLAEPGDYEGLSDFDGADQQYFVVVPPSYADVVPIPLYLWLASGGGYAPRMHDGWRPLFEDEPMLIAIAATQTATQQAPETLLALVDDLAADYCIDLQRVHVYGSSSSASAAALLACEGSDRIASFFDGMGYFAVEGCEPERPVPLMAITGDPDRNRVTASVERWAERNGCDPEPLVEDLGSGIARKAYQNCAADVLFYDIEGLGHRAVVHACMGSSADIKQYCAEYDELDEVDEAQRFFAENPLPE